MTRHPGVNMTCTTDITPKSPSPLAPSVGGERKAFVFYYNWYTDVCDNLNRAEQGEFFLAIARYAVTGQLPDDTFSPAIRSMFGLVRPAMDRNVAKFAKVLAKRAKNQNAQLVECQQADQDGVIIENREWTIDNSDKQEKEEARSEILAHPTAGTASHPTVGSVEVSRSECPVPPHPSREEVAAYWKERGMKSDPGEFYAFYETRHWINRRGERITSWKRAACLWEDKYVHDVLPMRRREERAAASEAAASRHKAEAVEAEQLRRTERAAREAEADRRAARAVSPEQGRRMYQNALLLCNNDHEAALRLLQRAPGDPALFKRLSQ